MDDKSSTYDVIIVGSGPAGLSAAIWCSDLGLSSVVLEKEAEKGGQLLHIYNSINNYPGCSAANGLELRDRFLESVSKSHANFVDCAEITGIGAKNMSVVAKDGRQFSGRSLMLATGIRRRRLNLPGESRFAGKGILESGTKEKNDVSNRTVAIVGGGDAALENSLILAQKAQKVYVIHRSGDFRARNEFVSKAIEHPRIEFIFDNEVTAINGSDALDSLDLLDRLSGESRVLPVDRLLVRIGVEPNSELFRDQVELDNMGYVVVDRSGRTNTPGVYAVGDVANPISPTIATSVGSAAAAVKHIASELSGPGYPLK